MTRRWKVGHGHRGVNSRCCDFSVGLSLSLSLLYFYTWKLFLKETEEEEQQGQQDCMWNLSTCYFDGCQSSSCLSCCSTCSLSPLLLFKDSMPPPPGCTHGQIRIGCRRWGQSVQVWKTGDSGGRFFFCLFLLVLVCLLSGGSGRPSCFDEKPLWPTRAEVQAAPIPLLASRRHGWSWWKSG